LRKKGIKKLRASKVKGAEGFTIVEAMIAIVILAIGLLGVGYTIHVSYSIGQENVRTIHRAADEKGEVGIRDKFNQDQANIYGKLQ
jgi:type II secretory pathway pseudopilin PulG